MELFEQRGYANTTVADIAERADLTERTFFRYFVDKREVLFSGSKDLEKSIVDLVVAAPKDTAPLDIVAHAFETAGAGLQARRDMKFIRARWAIVTGHPEVRERELIKMASLASAVTKALRARGVPDPDASIAAEAGITVFKVGYERWLTTKKPGDFASHIRAAIDALRAVTASGPQKKRR